jgi:hypothetical protein
MSGREHSYKWFLAGLILVGGTTGYLLAISRSPVVGVVIPLLFGLVGGVGGLYVAKEDLNSEAGRHRLALIGRSLTALSLALLGTSTITLLWLANVGKSSRIVLSELPGYQRLTPSQLSALVEARAQLETLRVPVNEQKDLLERSIAFDADRVVAKKLRLISDDIETVQKSLSSLQESNGTADTAPREWSPTYSVIELRSLINATLPLLQKWASDLDAGRNVPSEAVNLLIDGLHRQLRKVTENPFSLAAVPGAAKELLALDVTMIANRPALIPVNIVITAEKILPPPLLNPRDLVVTPSEGSLPDPPQAPAPYPPPQQ